MSTTASMLRLLLLAEVAAGIVAMHVLGGHESMNGSVPMSMAAPVAAPLLGSHRSPSADAMPAAAMPAMPVAEMPAMPVAGRTAMQTAVVSAITMPVNGTSNRVGPGDMAHMATCCLLYLATVGLVLLGLLAVARLRDSAPGLSPRSMISCPVRGPPGVGPPRISLCVLRV